MKTLTYVVSTRNKLPALRKSLPRLIAAKQADEEIVVMDGASTDGTTEYLEQLLAAGQIDQYVSEPDFGESHGFNKAMALARGELLKIITDDDFFWPPAIQACKQFLLTHPDIDLLSANGQKKRFEVDAPYQWFRDSEAYECWRATGTPFAFCGLGLMIRKRSLPLTGWLNPSYVKVDAEFSLRVTAGKAALAWYTGVAFVHLANPGGNTFTKHDRIYAETIQLDQQYLGRSPSVVARARYFLTKFWRSRWPAPSVPAVAFDSEHFGALFADCERHLQTHPELAGTFLVPKGHLS